MFRKRVNPDVRDGRCRRSCRVKRNAQRMKPLSVSASELSCTPTQTSPSYESIYVDESMNRIHIRDVADARDTLQLETSILSAESDYNEYILNRLCISTNA